jgi:long-chain acyl-CoA synthetase
MATAVDTRRIVSGGPRPTPGTLAQLFFEAVERYDKPDALQSKVRGAYQPISHRTLATRVRHIGLALRALGIERGARVGILSENRPEWAIADYACLTTGLVDVPVYPTLPAEQIAYILKDAGVVALFVSTDVQAAKVAEVRPSLPALRYVIGCGDTTWPGVDLNFDELEARGKDVPSAPSPDRYRAEALTAKPDDLATLIYTSGTTGEPKGVMLTHDNFYSNVSVCADVLPFRNDVALSFLPLSHVFERMGDYLMMACGVSIAYAESIDTVPTNMQEVRPTVMMSVPRLYEKMYSRVLENALAGGQVKKRIFFWARGVADKWADETLAGRTPRGLLAFAYRVAQKLVFSKLKARTGGRMRYFVSGGAPLAPEINKFFYAAGLTILEGYGLTETSPVIAVNTPQHFRIGTVGRPIPGVEVVIAPDGEILTRGPHVMKGYYNKPEATREAIDADGWLHTGDIGELREGFLAITDRKKDIIVTAGGKNIAPQPIENRLKANKFFTEVVMIGNKRSYPAALVVPNFALLEEWAKSKGIAFASREELVGKPEVEAFYEARTRELLPDLAQFEKIKKLALLTREFSVDEGELTPTLKVKRRVIEQKYKDLIDRMYEQAA